MALSSSSAWTSSTPNSSESEQMNKCIENQKSIFTSISKQRKPNHSFIGVGVLFRSKFFPPMYSLEYWNILIGFCTRSPIKAVRLIKKNYCCALSITNRINRSTWSFRLALIFVAFDTPVCSFAIPPYWWDRLYDRIALVSHKKQQQRNGKKTTTEKTKIYTHTK